MPFLRIARDKRGYEHTYLIHTNPKKGGATRILYWFRTPPGIKVGRIAFDDDVRRALEAQYPSITFDWPKLMEAPPPPPDVEHWRERRRLEKAARQARRASERDDTDEAVDPSVHASPNAHREGSRSSPEPAGQVADATLSRDAADVLPAIEDPGGTVTSQDGGDAAGTSGRTGRKRRRRGGRRRRRMPGEGEPAALAAGSDLETSPRSGADQTARAEESGDEDDGPDPTDDSSPASEASE